jgi:hypothetical protein
MSAYISVELQRKIRDRFADCCAYCLTAESLTATTFEFEHIIPRSAGGETSLENLCFSCPNCNRYKANRQNIIVGAASTLENPDSGEIIRLFHPQLQVWKEHFNWNEDASEIVEGRRDRYRSSNYYYSQDEPPSVDSSAKIVG